MKKIKYISFCTLILGILFVISSTDLILKEEKEVIYNISVIFGETSDEAYSNYVGGIKQALFEWMADVNYVSLYHNNNEEEQFQLILREVKNGADALIVFPVNRAYLEKKMEENMINIPVVFVGAESYSERVAGFICPDSYSRGKELAQVLVERETASKAYVFSDVSNMDETTQMFRGLKEVFSAKDMDAVGYRYSDDDFLYHKLIEIRKEKQPVLLIGLDAGTLEKIANWQGYNERFLIYGMGYNKTVLTLLYDNKIKAVNIVNEYGVGYQCFTMAVAILEQEKENKGVHVSHMMIYPEDVFDSSYEKILFPNY